MKQGRDPGTGRFQCQIVQIVKELTFARAVNRCYALPNRSNAEGGVSDYHRFPFYGLKSLAKASDARSYIFRRANV